ncbi:MAG: NAD-glutamate dehydrogenase domain-containing protein, partial [Rickettsiales bacterium]
MDDYKQKFKTYLDRIVKKVPKKAGEELRLFVQQFYNKMPLVDVEAMDPERACTVAISAYDFIKERKVGEPKIRIFTPNKKDYGWKSEKAIIEIINDDMPFLVDSISAELSRHDLTVYSLIHPVFRVKRDNKGILKAVKERGDNVSRHGVDDDASPESFMHIQVSALPEELSEKALIEHLHQVLKAVAYGVEDWRKILSKIPENIEIVENAPKSFHREDVDEVKDFLHWVGNNNFVLLGYIEYDFTEKKKDTFKVVPGSELGLFRLEDDVYKPTGLSSLPTEVLKYIRNPQLLEITKGNKKSPIHRPVHMDYLTVKRFDKKGRVVGENRFLGLFTSKVYYQSADDIPIIRRKIDRVLGRANFDPVSHNGKALKAIMEFFPRDELFQISEEDLFQTGMGILSLDARPDVRLFIRKDLFERFISCMLYVPRERFSTYLREKIQTILEKAYNGKVTAHYTQVTDSPLARVHLFVRTTPGNVPQASLRDVEAEISRVTNLWSDSLLEALIDKYGDKKGERLARIYRNAFPANYVTHYSSDSAVYDIQKIDDAVTSGNLALDLFRKKQDAESFVRLKVYNPNAQVPLSDILPMLENMGFRVLDENPYLITPKDGSGTTVWVRDLRLAMDGLEALNIEKLKDTFEHALAKVWHGKMENDGLNALVMKAGLEWRDIVLMRAYTKYLCQTSLPYSQQLITQALVTHPQITCKLVELFKARFENGSKKKEKKSTEPQSIVQSINRMLNQVSNIAEDRIIRTFVNVLESTLRTNFFQPDENGHKKDYISFKLNSQAITELPLPRPFREIFVYSLRVEGIHLRGGKVARGGLRWSDRPEDFRTEVLGLMKAQMVKNAIIVPVGSKGGFVVKRPPTTGGREAMMEEGIACYKTFLRGLLDLTDNVVKGKVVPPKHVVRHDENDPYLVVAADKGTATFSDIANGISKEYGFWLHDAFASGGSAGYDHKKMGITARGAWVSVAWHFRE